MLPCPYPRKGFSGGSDGEKSACSVGDLGLIPRWERYFGEQTDHPLQDSCLENSKDRGVSQVTVHIGLQSWTLLIN